MHSHICNYTTIINEKEVIILKRRKDGTNGRFREGEEREEANNVTTL